MILNSKLSPGMANHALRAAWPGMGFHVKDIGNGQLDVVADNAGLTQRQLQAALDAWRTGGGLKHAKEMAITRVREVYGAQLTGFLPASQFMSDEAAAEAWAAHLRGKVSHARALIDQISAAKDEEAIQAIDLEASWPN